MSRKILTFALGILAGILWLSSSMVEPPPYTATPSAPNGRGGGGGAAPPPGSVRTTEDAGHVDMGGVGGNRRSVRFLRYDGSAYERHFPRWHNGRPCEALQRHSVLGRWNAEYVDWLPRCCVPHRPPPPKCDDGVKVEMRPIQGLPTNVFSSMVYEVVEKDVKSGKTKREEWIVPIEPLAGVLRHPALCSKIEAAKPHQVNFMAVVDKGYFVVDPAMARVSPGKRIFFDVGGSTWNEGPGGASQQYFYDLYRSYCMPIDEYFVWEGTPLPANVVDRVPSELRPHYHWYNVLASAEATNEMNPLNKLREVAKPEDYVIFKLDIDHGPTEIRIVDQILVDERLWGLIDEFFFEHHVDFSPMNAYWGGSMQGTMNDSLKVFKALRQRGIRAHSWV